CMAAAEAVCGDGQAGLLPGVAIECLHTYTLIHDDLPAMDDDALRRGKPTCHVAFGEANAILAGDALLTFAFELLGGLPPDLAGLLVRDLAEAAGSRGVIGGQVEDMLAEGEAPSEDRLAYIHTHKTARLIQAACRMGGRASGASAEHLALLGAYGEDIGLAFQITDDILDEVSTDEVLGKPVGSDAERKKMTYTALFGIERAREEARRLVDHAVESLGALPADRTPLEAIAHYVIERVH
ncbi:MAG: polyprenyl synthetase family protein, partial [Spartobacteria bacterium]|nr:polyprenyl synthetase family protein [Spartobacteria bacterium]